MQLAPWVSLNCCGGDPPYFIDCGAVKGIPFAFINFRLFLVLVRIAIGSILLSDTVITPSLVSTTDPEIVDSGYGSFNSSLVNGKSPDEIVISLLIQPGSFLIDPADVVTFPPFDPTCASSDECFSVVFPGGVPDGLNISTDPTDDGFVYVIVNATGVQLDFFAGPEPSFEPVDCSVHGTNTSGLAACVKNVNNSLYFGWSLCPQNLIATGGCTENLTWSTSPTLDTWLSVSSLVTTTAYSLGNLSILSVTPETNSQYFVNIPAEGIRSILDYALTNNSVSVELLVSAIQLSNSLVRSEAEQLRIFRGVLAIVILGWGTNGSELGPATGYYAASGYRITVSPITRAVFAVLSVGVLSWSLLALLFCWFLGSPSPNSSQFPEVNFAAKVVPDDGILAGLGNTTSMAVIKRIQGQVLYVGSMPSGNGAERVAIATGRGLQGLRYRQPYL